MPALEQGTRHTKHRTCSMGKIRQSFLFVGLCAVLSRWYHAGPPLQLPDQAALLQVCGAIFSLSSAFCVIKFVAGSIVV